MLKTSRRTRNWIVALILIPAAAYGVARLAVWYSVKDGLADIQDSMAPFASLEHSKILSPVFGAFGATGIRIKPHMFEDEITIGSALVHIEDPIEKYRYLSATMRDTIPTSFNFSLNGVQIPLNGDIAGWVNTNAMPTGSTSAPARACTAGTGFSLGDLKEMGYEDLVASFKADYAYDRRGRGLSVYLKLEVREMFDMTLEGRIPPSDVVFATDRMTGVPRLSDVTLTLRDLSWSPRFNRYCARILGISETAYVDKRVEDTREAFMESGFTPSEELLAGFRSFAQGTGSLTLSLNPREPFNPTQLDMDGDPEYIIDRLGLEVMIEGKPVRNLGAVREVVVEETESQPEQLEETFKPTPLAELPQYLKTSVQVLTTDGKQHEGYLESIDSEKIVLTRELAGGSATFDVVREDVEQVFVLRP
ncbi:MAG: hypothetical protein U5R46_07595 [Gammaproteobacteria bacterium]|nr:hypothetical protein [Gammaproteobacteria bacterium]